MLRDECGNIHRIWWRPQWCAPSWVHWCCHARATALAVFLQNELAFQFDAHEKNVSFQNTASMIFFFAAIARPWTHCSMRISCRVFTSLPLGFGFQTVDRVSAAWKFATRCPYIPHKSAQTTSDACFPCLCACQHLSASTDPGIPKLFNNWHHTDFADG